MMKKYPDDLEFAVIRPIGSEETRVFVHIKECPQLSELTNGHVDYQTRWDDATGRLFATWIGETIEARRRRRKEREMRKRPMTLGPNVDGYGYTCYVIITTTTGEERPAIFNRRTRLGKITAEYAFNHKWSDVLSFKNEILDPESTAEKLGIENGDCLFEGILPSKTCEMPDTEKSYVPARRETWRGYDEGPYYETSESEEAEEKTAPTKRLKTGTDGTVHMATEMKYDDEEDYASMIDTLRNRLMVARDKMHKAMIELSGACKTYNRIGPGDGLDIIKEEINFDIFKDRHQGWWTDDEHGW